MSSRRVPAASAPGARRYRIEAWDELPDYVSVNLSERDSAGLVEEAARRQSADRASYGP